MEEQFSSCGKPPAVVYSAKPLKKSEYFSGISFTESRRRWESGREAEREWTSEGEQKGPTEYARRSGPP